MACLNFNLTSGLGQVLGPAGIWSPETERPEQGEPHEDASLSQAGETVSATQEVESWTGLESAL